MVKNSDSSDPGRTDADSRPRSVPSNWKADGSPSLATIERIAEATGRGPTAMPPLYESVDTDALDALVTGSASTNGRTSVTFTHAGVEVTIDSDGEIETRTDGVNPEATGPSPQTDSELNALLKRLLNAAARNGISISGGWVVRNGPDLPDWDVHITEVTKPED